MQASPFGTLSSQSFMRRYWQRQPVLLRGAMPHAVRLVSRRRLETLARRDDVESRLVEHRLGRWRVEHGPLSRTRIARAGARSWSLLVSGVNLHDPPADALLRRFQFLPQARLDDVMVSYATPGGGVGPHFDSYDVFLVQSLGRRVWRLAPPGTATPIEDAPLKLVHAFRPTEEWLAEPGDLLYVPPGWIHDGVALDSCVTCSVGFRAPGGAELASSFLDWLAERGLPDRGYSDPDLRATRSPARVPAALLEHAEASLAAIRWSSTDTLDFLGSYLSTPKPNVVFEAPARAPRWALFDSQLRNREVRLDLRTQMLYRDRFVFINGESVVPAVRQRKALEALANRRRAAGGALRRAGLGKLLYSWYRLGYLHLLPRS